MFGFFRFPYVLHVGMWMMHPILVLHGYSSAWCGYVTEQQTPVRLW
jgi:hypothetical protein